VLNNCGFGDGSGGVSSFSAVEGTVMGIEAQVRLAGSSWGRVILHICAMWVDGRVVWHLGGVVREMVGI
jgi:hypothetical protein